ERLQLLQGRRRRLIRVPTRLLRKYAVRDSAQDFAVLRAGFRSSRDSRSLRGAGVEEKAVWQFFWAPIVEGSPAISWSGCVRRSFSWPACHYHKSISCTSLHHISCPKAGLTGYSYSNLGGTRTRAAPSGRRPVRDPPGERRDLLRRGERLER